MNVGYGPAPLPAGAPLEVAGAVVAATAGLFAAGALVGADGAGLPQALANAAADPARIEPVRTRRTVRLFHTSIEATRSPAIRCRASSI